MTAVNVSAESYRPEWASLLKQALDIPGHLSKGYRMFHNYSLGNQILAMTELMSRGLPLSPIASFHRWKQLGRSVKKGEKGLSLIMPVTLKKKVKEEPESGHEPKEGGTFNLFVLKRHWFSLDQTDGEDYRPVVDLPGWDKRVALRKLRIVEVAFRHLNGNCQGYACDNTVAVSPVATLPHKTLFHEIAHVLLGHTGSQTVMSDAPEIPKCLREAEAEATAYLCCATLELPGMPEARGYIQNWLDGAAFPETSARRVFTAADKILKAGIPQTDPEGV